MGPRARRVSALSSGCLALLAAQAAALEDPFAAVHCGEDAAAAAFARGDVSAARAELAAFKEAPKRQRDCAAKAWQAGVAALGAAAGASSSSESRVLPQVGLPVCRARVEDGSWLSIPRVQEVLVCLDLGDRVLALEQDGFLRAFDMATVLWPPGFFLTLWISKQCQMFQGRRVLDLGAGVGAASVAASLCGAADVLATEKEPYGLVNIEVNAQINSAYVQAQVFDWHSDPHLGAVASKGPFDVILGGGVAPHRWLDRLWTIVPKLLQPRTGKLLLCQGIGDLELTAGERVAGGRLAVEEVVNGDALNLQTRWGDSSEFELVVVGQQHRVEL